MRDLLHDLMPAVRAYTRLMTDWQHEAYQYEACDRHFDGGEWSGPAWGRLEEEVQKKYLALVANRFGHEEAMVEAALTYAEHEFMCQEELSWTTN